MLLIYLILADDIIILIRISRHKCRLYISKGSVMQDLIMVSRESEIFVKRYMPSPDRCSKIADFYAIFADTTRVRILSTLSIAEMCVGDICYMLKTNQTTVSHQLKVLRDAGMVKSRREGKIIVYSIDNKYIPDVMVTAVDNLESENRYRIVD